MSLELAIEKNTEALLSLHAVLAGLTLTASAQGPKSVAVAGVNVSGSTTAKTDAPTKTASASTQPAESAVGAAQASTAATPTRSPDPKSAAVSPQPETAAVSPASKPEASKSEAAVTYDDVKALVLQVSKDKGRDAAAAVLSGFGVAKAPELKPGQYADAVAQLKAALA